MPKTRLTRRNVAAMPKPAKREVHWDTDLKGFGLEVMPSGQKTWLVDYTVKGGARRREKLGRASAMTPEEATALATDRLARAQRGEDPLADARAALARKAEEATAATVADLLAEYIRRHMEQKRKPRTTAGYASLAAVHINPALGKRPAAGLTEHDLTTFHESVARKAVAPSRPGLKRSPKTRARGGETTANRAHAVLRAALRWGVRVGLLPKGSADATAAVEPYRERERGTFLDPDHVARLGAALALAEGAGLPTATGRTVNFDPEAVAALRVLMLSGMRLREALNARWADVDLAQGHLWLSDAKRGARRVDLPAQAVAVIRALPRKGAYVFGGPKAGTAEECPRADLNRLWAAVKVHARLPEGFRLHDLRHHVGRVAAEAGRSLHEVAGLLGHSQQRTAARYARFSPAASRRVADEVGGAIAEALGLGGNVVSLEDRRARA